MKSKNIQIDKLFKEIQREEKIFLHYTGNEEHLEKLSIAKNISLKPSLERMTGNIRFIESFYRILEGYRFGKFTIDNLKNAEYESKQIIKNLNNEIEILNDLLEFIQKQNSIFEQKIINESHEITIIDDSTSLDDDLDEQLKRKEKLTSNEQAKDDMVYHDPPKWIEHTCIKCKDISVECHIDPEKRIDAENQLIEHYFGWKNEDEINSICRECSALEEVKNITKTEKSSKTSSQEHTISYLQCEKVLKYKRKIIDKELVKKCIILWDEDKLTVDEICKKIYWVDNSKVRRHIQTPQRLPNNLTNEISKIISDPESIVTIAYYSTDYFRWTKENDVSDEKVLKLGIKLAEGIAKFHDLRRKLMGKRG